MFPRLSAYLHIIQPPQVTENTFWYAETALWRCTRKNDILFDLLTESAHCLEGSGNVWNFFGIVFQVWICYKKKYLVWKNVDASRSHVQKFTFLKKRLFFLILILHLNDIFHLLFEAFSGNLTSYLQRIHRCTHKLIKKSSFTYIKGLNWTIN